MQNFLSLYILTNIVNEKIIVSKTRKIKRKSEKLISNSF